jgi:hypothetical protein
MYSRVFLCLAFVLVTTMASFSAGAADAKSVMQKSRDLRRGFTNSVADVEMSLSTGGKTVARAMRQYVLEVSGDGNRTINVFSKPADVDGVSVLTHSALNGQDKQWLFLPSIGRVKRISTSNRSGAFVGSEFAYEDLSSFEVEKYAYDSVSDGKLDGRDVLIVEYRPRYSNSGYTRLRSFLDPSNYQPLRIEYFNRRGEHFKTLTLSDYRDYRGGSAWRAHLLVMDNLTNGNSTKIRFSKFKPSSSSTADFNPNRFSDVR